MRTRSTRALRDTITLLGLSVCVLTAGACSAGSSNSAAPAPLLSAGAVHLGAIPQVSSVKSLTLPIEAYLHTVSSGDEMLRANAILIGKCLAGYGFSYTPPTFATPPDGPSADAANMARRYGVSDPQQAAVYGYHPLPAMGAQGTGTAPGGAGTGSAVSGAERLVLLGDSQGSGYEKAKQEYAGKPIPPGGCAGDARRKLGSGLDERLAESINDASYHQSLSDPRVQVAFGAWSTCMAGKGYKLGSPVTAPGYVLAAQPTGAEIETAQADVACKQQTNVIGLWFAVETALQKDLIGRNEEALGSLKQEFTNTLRNAAAVIAQG